MESKNNNTDKEPQDSIPKSHTQQLDQNQIQPEEKYPHDSIPKEIKEEENIKINEEENKNINNEEIQKMINEKSEQLINFSNELENILITINIEWEKSKEGYFNYYSSFLIPKFKELLDYPCITTFHEKILLIFRFLCKYLLSRKKYLKDIPINELMEIITFINPYNSNIFLKNPNNVNNQNYELIDDKYFYQIFKELLPDKEIENSYMMNHRNCMFKYLIEFLFQSGFIDSYIDNVMTNNNLSLMIYAQASIVPFFLFNYCDKDFLMKNNYNIRMIKNFNEKMDAFLSENNKNKIPDEELYQFSSYVTNCFSDMLFGIFNQIINELTIKYKEDCEKFCLTVIKLGEYLLKNQKINIRMSGMQSLFYLFQFYIDFKNHCDDYKKKYHDDVDKIIEFASNCAVGYINKMNIFDLVFGKNIHEGIIQRSPPVFIFLYRNKLLSREQIKTIWNLSQTTYQSISNSIIELFGQLLPEFSNEDCNIILNIVAKMNFKDVNETTLKLLENFVFGNERRELLLNILFMFTNELSYEKGLTKNIIYRSRAILVKLLFNKNYINDLIKYMKNCIFYINKFYLVNTYTMNLMEILDEFDRIKNMQKARDIYKKINNGIENFGMMISYFDEIYKIFPILMNYLINSIKIYKFFYTSTLNIMNQVDQGNFNYEEELLNINNLYTSYKDFINKNMNFYYSLNNNNKDDENSMDIDYEANNNNNIFNNDANEQIIINDLNYEHYIKNIINDYILFIKETFLSKNIVPSKDEIKNNIFEKLKIFFDRINYNECINNILKIIYINHLRGNIHFKINYLNFLFNIGKNTQDIDPSIEWYYKLLSDLFSSQINSNNNLNLLSDENLEYLLKEHIYKVDYKKLPPSAFNIVNLFCIYVNQKNNNAIYSPLIQKYTEIKSNFYGFINIWQFFLLTKNDLIYNQALNVLINILELTSKNIENRNKFINDIFNFLQQNKNQINNNQDIKTAFIRNLKLISIVNGTKFSKSILDEKDDNSIEITIKNYYFTSQNTNDNISKIKIPKGIKINNLKEYIINNIVCTPNNLNLYNQIVQYNNNSILNDQNNMQNMIENNNANNNNNLEKTLSTIDELKKEVYKTNILISYKNRILQDEFSLSDYKVENNANLTILKGSGFQEEEYKPTEDELKAGYEVIKHIFEDNIYFSEEVMKQSIIKHKGNSQEAALYLTVPENVKILEKEIEDKKKRVEQKVEEIDHLEQDKIDLLIDVLNNTNDEEISNNIWQLFSEIKYPDDIIQNVVKEELSKILNESNFNKFILYLKLLNSLIFGDDFCKFNKISIDIKNNWISAFIKNENIINNIFVTLSTLNQKLTNDYKIYQILNIFINWFHTIIININELVKKENPNSLPGINLLRQFNSENNIPTNNNNQENNNKSSEQFIINKDEANNFIIILYKINGIESFYKILKVVLDTNIKENEKLNILENIFEIIITYLILQPKTIFQFGQIEKKNNILINIICNEKNINIGKLTKNFIKALLSNTLTLIDKKEIDSENNIYNVFCLSFIQRLMNDAQFNDQFCDLFGNLLGTHTNEIMKLSVDPLIYKLINNTYDLCIKFDPSDHITRQKIVYQSYILYCFIAFYKDNLKAHINKLLYEDKKDFIQLIYNCLFEIYKDKNKIIPFKFREKFLRRYSIDLLTELLTSDNNYLVKMLPKLLSQQKSLKELKNHNNQIPFDLNLRLPEQKFVGLRNFGCTCYLNSLFQQMFMIPTFRHDLFNFIIKYNTEDEYIYSVIYNMQITFQNLISGWMSPYPPLRFIKSFLTAFNGEPIHFGIMQDSDEFLSILCDNLEKEAKNFGNENFLENSFKGKISNEILSLEKEYPYYSQSEEPFYRVTLDIKGHKTLEEALDAYIKGEILDGDNKYFVEKYNRKISIRKSNSLKILGNQIIIHLKRFEFDFYTFTNKKLSDYLKFPREINFKKWTRAYLRTGDNNISKDLLNITKEEENNLIDDNMDYILTGILIHGGSNLQSGHYYSFIMDQETGKWHCFNDNTISDFNIENDLEKECFGNITEEKNHYGRTAYLLFYTNKKCFENKKLFKELKVNENILNDVYNENSTFLSMISYTNIYYFNFIKRLTIFASDILEDSMNIGDVNTLTLNNNLKNKIKIYYRVLSVINGDNSDDEDNNDSIDENCNNEKDITKNEKFEQIYNKCKEEVESFSKQEKINKNETNNNNFTKKHIIKIYFNYLFGIVFQYMSMDQNLLCQGLETLNNVLKKNPGYSLWILKQIEKNVDIFTFILFKYGTTENEMNDLNKLIIEFFQITFEVIYNFEKHEAQIMAEEIKYFEKDDKGKYIIIKEYKSIIMRIIKKLFCDNLEKSRMEFAKNSLYLLIFYNFVKNYPEISLVCSNYLPTIISLVTNNTLTDIKSKSNPNYYMGNSKGYNVNNNYIMIFSDIILRCITPGMENTNTYSPYYIGIRDNEQTSYKDFSKYPHLPEDWEKMLSTEFFITFVLFHGYCKSKEIICHLCYGHEKTSVKILSLINIFIRSKNTPLPFIDKILSNALNVFELKDALEFVRLDTLFQLNDNKNIGNKEPIDIEENKPLFEYLYEERENHINLVLYILYNIGKSIEKYDIVYK